MPSLPRAAIPTACALLGALVMPHNIFLHSALVHSRPVEGLSASGMPRLRSAAAKKVGGTGGPACATVLLPTAGRSEDLALAPAERARALTPPSGTRALGHPRVLSVSLPPTRPPHPSRSRCSTTASSPRWPWWSPCSSTCAWCPPLPRASTAPRSRVRARGAASEVQRLLLPAAPAAACRCCCLPLLPAAACCCLPLLLPAAAAASAGACLPAGRRQRRPHFVPPTRLLAPTPTPCWAEIGLANAGGYLGRAFGASFSLIFGVGLVSLGFFLRYPTIKCAHIFGVGLVSAPNCMARPALHRRAAARLARLQRRGTRAPCMRCTCSRRLHGGVSRAPSPRRPPAHLPASPRLPATPAPPASRQLAAGQSSTMTGTYAGQWVMSGFLDLRVRLPAALAAQLACLPAWGL